ncbi:MAG: pantetheine-phosphate adenylyltransferase [Armatimonadetes bacterium CG07_land_8_20_14_0_80_40_9]|nr:MAG: pantetheine-phosphate adenylyltransferase [Armatimonadetes bacterium CG07_land_8_20_14_0_80_40_9]
MKVAVYPGSFDPVTNGHLDIIERASPLFDQLIVTVAQNLEKKPLFSVNERVEMLKAVTSSISNVQIDTFEGLLVNYLKKQESKIIVKGLRAVTDFEIELQMALINKKLSGVETVFLVTSTEYSYLSSSIVKEIASLGGCVEGLVPKEVEKRLREKFGEK